MILEPGELADEIMGNALLLNSTIKFSLMDTFDCLYTDMCSLVYLVSSDPNRYTLSEAYIQSGGISDYLRKIVRLP